jgi:hypothetical protein
VSQTGPPSPQQPPPGWGAAPPPPGWGQATPPPAWGQPQPPYPGYGWGGPPPSPKPGSIPLRPLGVGDILEGTFSVLRRYPAATLGSSVLVVGTVSLLQALLFWPLVTSLSGVLDAAESGDPDLLVAELDAISWAPLALAGLLIGLLSVTLFVLLSGLLSIVVGQSAIGAPLSFSQAWGRALPRLPRLLGGAALVALLIGGLWTLVVLAWFLAAWSGSGVGYALLTLLTLLGALPLTLYLGVKVSLTTPAVALESTADGPISPVTGLRRSWGLVRGAWWRTLGVLLLGAVIAGALSQVIAIPAGIVVSALPLSLTAAVVASTITAGLGQAVAQPVSGLILAMVYVDRRIRTEQLDAALARAAGVELPSQAAPPPSGQQAQ